MLAWTKHGDVVQFSTPLVHDESRQHRDLFLETRWFARSRDHTDGKSRAKRQANDCFRQRVRGVFPRNARHDVNAKTFQLNNKNLFSRGKKTAANRGRNSFSHRILDHEIREEGNFVRNILSSCFWQAERRHFHRAPQRGRFIKSIWTIFPAFAARRSSYIVFIAANIRSRRKNPHCWRGTLSRSLNNNTNMCLLRMLAETDSWPVTVLIFGSRANINFSIKPITTQCWLQCDANVNTGNYYRNI